MKTGNKRYSLVSILALVMVLTLAFAMVGCETGEKPNEFVDHGETGAYYYEAENGEWIASLTKGVYTLTTGDDNDSGAYSYDEETKKIVFESTAGTTFNGTHEKGAILLEYKGGQYLFRLKTNYTVTLVAGEEQTTQTVVNGKTAKKPTDPEKKGYVFIGWYKNAEYTESYDFESTPVTDNVTVYGRFEEKEVGQKEYEVKYVVDGATYGKATTVNGRIVTLPTPQKTDAKFVGWWTSNAENAEKLTAKYEGGKFTADATLYAVWETTGELYVSITGNKVTWTGVAPNVNYNVKIVGPNGYDNSVRTQATNAEVDFATLEAGEYEVTVEYSTYTGKAYYKNKALDKVSGIKVIEPSTLVFDPVENADYYLVTVNCGNKRHNHKNFNNGKSTNFSFASCDMTEKGITFTITACAYGYLDSVATTYTCLRSLGEITGIKETEDGNAVVWNKVDGATEYHVTVKNGENTYTETVGNATRYDLGQHTGTIEITVVAKTFGYNASAPVTLTVTRNKLAAPTNVRVSENRAFWDAVTGADGYVVYFDGKEYETTATNFNLKDYISASEKNTFTLKVKAVAEGETGDSVYTEATTVYVNAINGLRYENGKITWIPVANAYQYKLKVNNGKEVVFDAADHATYPVKLTASGENVIALAFVDARNVTLSYVTVTVDAVAVYFDARGGAAVETEYYAPGDVVTLPETQKEGYEFDGWYNTPNGPKSNGKKYEAGTRFDANGDVAMYAYWASATYNVTLEADGGVELTEKIVEVSYGEKFELGVPSSEGTDKENCVFGGWYSAKNGGGVRYTDENGKSVSAYVYPANLTLYAKWIEIFTYTEEKGLVDPSTKAYAVGKGPGISLIKTGVVKVPATYNGLPVQTVNAGAFKNCTALTTVEIPETIQVIETGLDGELSSAFEGCTNLTAVNIYEVEGFNGTPKYSSLKGILIANGIGRVEFVPKGLTGSLVLPEGVRIIPKEIFKSAKMTSLVLPYTVAEIAESAFASCYNLTELAFEAAPAGVDKVEDLVIGKEAFKSCSKLIDVTLSTRLKTMDFTCFYGCSAVETIKIGATDGEKSVGGYYSLNNAICVDGEGNEKKLVYFAKGITGEYTTPDGVTTIGSLAFSGSKLTGIVIGEDVTRIEPYAFSGGNKGVAYGSAKGDFTGEPCRNLTSVVFKGTADSEYLTIGEGAFYNCDNIEELTLPFNLAGIDAYAFGSVRIATVNVEIGVTLTDEEAAKAYSNLAFKDNNGNMHVTTVYLSKDVPANFSVGTLFGSTKLTTVVVDEANQSFTSDAEGVLYDKAITVIKFYPKGRVGKFVVPATVTKIEGGVFEGAKSLTKVTIHGGVTEIGANAFASCTALTEVVFTAATAPQAEEGAEGTAKATLTIGDNAFKDCSKLAEIVLPAHTVALGEYVFKNCGKLVSIVIPKGVTAMGDGSFYGCDSLTDVFLPATLEKFGTYENDVLTDVSNAFRGCESLETIIVAEGNKFMKTVDGVLYFVYNVKDKTTEATEETAAAEATTHEEYELICVPAGYKGVVNVDKKTRKVWERVFNNKPYITKVVFGENKKMERDLTIGMFQFMECPLLEEIVLPAGLTKIDYYFIYGGINGEDLASLTKINVPYTVTTIMPWAFITVPTVTEFTFDETPEGELYMPTEGEAQTKSFKYPLTIENAANIYSPFRGLSSIKSIAFPERTVRIGAYAFGYDTKGGSAVALESVYIPASVESIGAAAFKNCEALTDVTFAKGSKLTAIPNECFMNTAIGGSETAKGTIVLPEGLKKIGYQAFASCNMLTTVTLPATLTELTDTVYTYSGSGNLSAGTFKITERTNTYNKGKAFYSCAKLEEVIFAKGSIIERIENDTFGYSGVKSIEIPASVKAVGQNSFFSAMSLETVTFGTYTLEDFGKTSVEELTEDEAKKLGLSSLATVESQAFASANGTTSSIALKEIYFPETVGVLTLGTNIFNRNAKMETVGIPSTVATLSGVFGGCVSDFDIVLSENNKSLKLYNDYRLVLSITGDTVEFAYGIVSVDTVDLRKLDNLVEIKENAFQAQENIRKIIVPYTVTTVGKYAFNKCTALEEVEFALGGVNNDLSSLTSLGEYAFSGCTALKTIEIPSSLETINNKTFEDCYSLETVTLHDGLKTLGTEDYTGTSSSSAYGVFEDCTSLKSIVIPNTVESVGSGLFAGCTSLQSVTLSNKITELYGCTFYNCYSLKTVELPEGLVDIGAATFCNSGLESIELPAGITVIGSVKSGNNKYGSVFSGCKALTSVVAKGSVTTIYQSTFYNASALATFDLSTVKEIQNSAFSGCSSFVGSKTTTEGGTETCVLDLSGVETFGTNVFNACVSLSNVNLKKADGTGLENLPDSLFYGCVALEQIELPTNVKYLGKSTFRGSGLRSIYLPKNVKTILSTATKSATALDTTSSYTFYGCVNLTTVTTELPSQLTNIGQEVFSGCTSLASIDLTGAEFIGQKAFLNTALGYKVLGEDEAYDYTLDIQKMKKLGQYAFDGNEYITAVKFGTAVQSGGYANYAFRNNIRLKTVDMPEPTASVTSIGTYFFYGCESLESFTLFSKVTSISGSMFYGTALKSFNVGKKITKINENAFQNCEQLKTITFDKDIKLTEIGNYAFKGCTLLDEFVMPTTVTKIGDYAFENCASLNLELPSKITEIGQYAFQNCVSLVGTEGTLTLPKSLARATGDSGTAWKVEQGAFAGCTGIKEFALDGSNQYYRVKNGILYLTKYGTANKETNRIIAVPAGYEKEITIGVDDLVGAYAFKGVANVVELSFEEGVEEIGSTAFYGFTGLATVNLPTTLKVIGNGAFNECVNLRNVSFPKGLEEIEGYAFKNNASLRFVTFPAAITAIGTEAFSGTGVEEFVVPATVETLGTGVLKDCKSLKTVDLGPVTKLPDNTFAGCVALTTVDLTNVTEIGKNAFDGCVALKGIDLTGITSIGNSAFANTFTALVEKDRPTIVIPATVETLGTNMFENSAAKEVTINCFVSEEGAPAALKVKTFLNSTVEKVVIGEGFTSIPANFFDGCKNIKEIVLPETVTEFGKEALARTKMDSYTVPEHVVKLDSYVFEEAEIDTVIIPETTTGITTRIFDTFKGKHVVMNAKIKYLSLWFFKNATELETLVLPDTLDRIEYGAFQNCTKLKKLVLPAGIQLNADLDDIGIFEGWTAEQTVYFRGPEKESENWGANWKGNGKMNVVYNYKGE